MNKIFAALLFLTLAALLPQTLRAELNISIGFALPEPLYFESPPEVIVLPDTQNVYVVPESDFELFFWNGYWWRPWEGHWYRSRHYDRGWGYYENVPNFYYDVDPRWRDSYRDQNWSGHRWHSERIPYQRLQNNWKQWHSNQYWQRNRSWGVERYQPRSRHQYEEIRAQRQEQYRQRPEVQRHQQQVEEQQRQSRPQDQQREKRQRSPQAPRHHQQVEEQQHQFRPQDQQSEQRQRPPQSPRHQQQVEEQQREPQPQEQQIEQRQRPPQSPRHQQQVEQRQRSPQRQMQHAETKNREQQHMQAPKKSQSQAAKEPEHRKSPQGDALIKERQHPGEANRQKVHDKQENQE